jgi:hypothetical protein
MSGPEWSFRVTLKEKIRARRGHDGGRFVSGEAQGCGDSEAPQEKGRGRMMVTSSRTCNRSWQGGLGDQELFFPFTSRQAL